MSIQPKIAVLLATYNGADFLSQQLESILQQSYSNFVIVVRDDGSTDNTAQLIRNFAREHPDRVHPIDIETASRGARDNFSTLITYVLKHKTQLGLDRSYMMFSDQDDIWQSTKMEQQARLMFEIEVAGTDTPVLVHSDLHVVNEKLEPIADSFLHYQGLSMKRNSFGQMLVSNLITGCTMFINEALAEKALPIPTEAVMHDWWLGLVATAYGKIAFSPGQLVDYRQHENNTLGAIKYNRVKLSDAGLLRRLISPTHTSLLADVAAQAEAFLARFHDRLTYRQRVSLRMTMGLRSKTGHVLFQLLRLLPA